MKFAAVPRFTSLFLLSILELQSTATASESALPLGPAEMRGYTEEITITFDSAEAAKRAHVKLAPLFHDYRAAFATRMDDSNRNDLRVAEIMAKYGVKGVFLLNDPTSWWQDSEATGVTASKTESVDIPRKLVAQGNAVGGHTLHHEMLPALALHTAFQEILGARIALEAASNSANVVFVYPFIAFHSPLRMTSDRAALDEMLRRAGYYSLAENNYNEGWNSPFLDARFISLDGNDDWTRRGETLLSQPLKPEERPLFLATMHPWVAAWGGADYPKLAAIYAKWSGRKDWWYCNPNQYSAYRYQFLHTKIMSSVEGTTVRVQLIRPDAADLGDDIPLTVQIENVATSNVKSVNSQGGEITFTPVGGNANASAFDLVHPADRRVPEIFLVSENSSSAAAAASASIAPQASVPAGVSSTTSPSASEGLRAKLTRAPQKLTLELSNESPRTLHGIDVTFRLPLNWQRGVIRKHLADLRAGQAATLMVDFEENIDLPLDASGTEYDTAEIDFTAQRRTRLYAICEYNAGPPADFFAKNGFWFLGPIPGDIPQVDPASVVKSFLEGAAPEKEYRVDATTNVAWRTLDRVDAARLDSDVIPVSNKSNVPSNFAPTAPGYTPHKLLHYALYGRIVSPIAQTVVANFSNARVKALVLNGEKVAGQKLRLKEGANDVRILYAPALNAETVYDENNYGCYFRLTQENGERVRNIRFERPTRP